MALVYFIITFTLSWKIWSNTDVIISWFETDEVFQRISILLLLTNLFGYKSNVTQALEHTYPTLVGFYLASRQVYGALAFQYGFCARRWCIVEPGRGD